METNFSFVHLIVVCFVALFPPVNPIGKAFLVDNLISDLSDRSRRWASFKIALYCFGLSLGTIFVGSWIFKIFGISLPIVQIAGGVMIAKMGWELLSASTVNVKTAPPEVVDADKIRSIEDSLFYPIAFPTTTGAGTISVLFTLSVQQEGASIWDHVVHLGALVIASFFMCVFIFICYAYTPVLIKKLGSHGEQMVNRLSAFLVFCVGIQIAFTGLSQIFVNKGQ